MTLHQRSCRRALDKVKAMRDDAVHPAKMQRYLIRWATWWCPVTGERKNEFIDKWVTLAVKAQAALAWYGQGLQIGSP